MFSSPIIFQSSRRQGFGLIPRPHHFRCGSSAYQSYNPRLMMHICDRLSPVKNTEDVLKKIRSATRQQQGDLDIDSLFGNVFRAEGCSKTSRHNMSDQNNIMRDVLKDLMESNDEESAKIYKSSKWQHMVDCEGFGCNTVFVKVLDRIVQIRGAVQQTSHDGSKVSRLVEVSTRRLPDYVDSSKVSCRFISKSKLLIEAPTKYNVRVGSAPNYSKGIRSAENKNDEDVTKRSSANKTLPNVLLGDCYQGNPSKNKTDSKSCDGGCEIKDNFYKEQMSSKTNNEKEEPDEITENKQTMNEITPNKSSPLPVDVVNLEENKRTSRCPSKTKQLSCDVPHQTEHIKSLDEIQTSDYDSISTTVNKKDLKVAADIKSDSAYTVEEPEEEEITSVCSETSSDSDCSFVFLPDSRKPSDITFYANDKQEPGEQTNTHEPKKMTPTLNEYNDNMCDNVIADGIKTSNRATQDVAEVSDKVASSAGTCQHFQVQLDMPYCCPESIRVTMDDDRHILNVCAYKESIAGISSQNFLEKVISVPDNVDSQLLRCQFQDGLLRITAPLKCQNGERDIIIDA